MTGRGVLSPKVVVAMARELTGYLWATLHPQAGVTRTLRKVSRRIGVKAGPCKGRTRSTGPPRSSNVSRSIVFSAVRADEDVVPASELKAARVEAVTRRPTSAEPERASAPGPG
jgi:hypothetical protein